MDGPNKKLLQRVALGELAPDAPEVQAAARADADFARELEETQAVLEGLDRAGREQAQILADARDRREAPGEAGVGTFVSARVAEARVRRASRFRVLATAAALLIAVLFWWRPGRGPVDPDVPLGPASIRLVVPVGASSDFGGSSEVPGR